MFSILPDPWLHPRIIYKALLTFLGIRTFSLITWGLASLILFLVIKFYSKNKKIYGYSNRTGLSALVLSFLISIVGFPVYNHFRQLQELTTLKRDLLIGNRTQHAQEQFQQQFYEAWDRLNLYLDQEIRVIQRHPMPQELIPIVSWQDIADGTIDDETRNKIRFRGVCVIRGVVDTAQAEKWRQDVLDYREANHPALGLPPFYPQIYEMYHSKPQVEARQHPHMALARSFLNRLWKYKEVSNDGAEQYHFDPDRDYTYLDRLRIRVAGDTKFALGPHMDSGSIERWSDPEYQKVYRHILNGTWEKYDPYDGKHRPSVKELESPNTSTFFRSHQGWLALSKQGPGDGTLEVVPLLQASTAYIIMRPLLKDLDQSDFCGAWGGYGLGVASRCYEKLIQAKITIPTVMPGDMVAWHPDVIHSIEAAHKGSHDSTVLYIPSSPLCLKNARYIAKQKTSIRTGGTPPDFPQLDVEPDYSLRASVSELSILGEMQTGFRPWSNNLDLESLSVGELLNYYRSPLSTVSSLNAVSTPRLNISRQFQIAQCNDVTR